MSILSLVEALLIDPKVTQERLDALESMIRTRTNNRFHRGHGLGPLSINGRTVRVPSATALPLRKGDTVELMRTGYGDGLYTVEAISEPNEVILEGEPLRALGNFPDGMLCLVQYPADVIEGLRGLLRFDKASREAAAAAPVGVEQLTVGRTTEKYGSSGQLVATAAGIFPGAVLDFLGPHRKLSWG